MGALEADGITQVRTDVLDAARLSSQGGLIALCTIARFHQVAAEPQSLAHQLGIERSGNLSTEDILRAAKFIGLKAKLTRTTSERIALTPLPALALMKSGTGDGLKRVVVLAQCDTHRVLYQDSSTGSNQPVIEPLETFAQKWTGELILITSRASLAGDFARFDFSWFIPSLVKYRRLLGEVLAISLALQLFALVSPLFFQVVMDKVLVHRGTTTLDVLVPQNKARAGIQEQKETTKWRCS